jgi:DNA-binding SARP family transcriptional activator
MRLSGAFRLLDPEGNDRTPTSRKGRALLAYLALARDGRASREHLRSLLWTDRSEAQARASLRWELSELHPLRRGPDPCLAADRSTVRLDLARVEVDLHGLAAEPAPPVARLRALWQGDLLDGLGELHGAFDGWLAGERVRWRETAIGHLAARLADPDPAERIAAASALLDLDPAHEPAHRALIREHLASGDRAAARRRFETCRAALARELDALPEEATRALLARPPGPPADPRPSRAEAAGLELLVPPVPGAPGDRGPELADRLAGLLARFRPLSVRLTDPSDADPLAAARRLGIRHLARARLEGAATSCRLALELIEAPTGRLLWSGAVAADAEDGLATLVAGRLVPALIAAEASRARRLPEAELLAHECVLLALPSLHAVSVERHAAAGRLLHLALERDPASASARAWLAWWLLLGRAGLPSCSLPRDTLAAATRHAQEAALLDPEDAVALAALAQCAIAAGHPEQALALSERALDRNPHLAVAHGQRAVLDGWRGDPGSALARIARCRALSPPGFDGPQLACTAARALLLTDRLEEAEAAAREIVAVAPHPCAGRTILAALALQGRAEEAHLRGASWSGAGRACSSPGHRAARRRRASTTPDFAKASPRPASPERTGRIRAPDGPAP